MRRGRSGEGAQREVPDNCTASRLSGSLWSRDRGRDTPYVRYFKAFYVTRGQL